MIEITNLTKRYGDFMAVNRINLQIAQGEIFAFLGMNGAGKTTTIRMMTGILQPTEGEVLIAGHNIAHEPIAAKSITGYIPDRPHIYPKLTGREFLYFVCELYRAAGPQMESRIDQLLEDYDLSGWQDDLVESYSHGMKQRLATCAALVHDPKVLILDEPMVGLDPHGARILKDNLRSYAEQGMTIFLSTHSLDVAEELADRLAIIHRGQIVSSGSLGEIRAQVGLNEHNLEELFLEITSAALR